MVMIARACTIPGLPDPDGRDGIYGDCGTGDDGSGTGIGATGPDGGVMGSNGSAGG